MPRKWEPREMRLVAEYIAATYPGSTYFTRLRVGDLHPDHKLDGLSEEQLRLVGNFRRWIDGAVILPDKIVLIEGAILPDLGDISKLESYKELLPYTPELQQHKDLPIELQYVAPIRDQFLYQQMAKKGILYILFRPDWIEDYLRELPNAKRLITTTANK